MRLSSPLSCKNTIFKDPDTIDQDYLHNRLNAILFTLQAEKEQFQEKLIGDKQLLEQKIALQEEQIKQLTYQNDKLQQEARQLRFNYHQRGSVVDYLKKKVTILETKFEQQKEEMLSVIKYLESRNYQLNEIIFQLKQKEVELNQSLYNLQQKYFNLTNELCIKNLNENHPNLKDTNPHFKLQVQKPAQRKSLCHKPNTEPLTPQTMASKHRNERIVGSNMESSLQIQSQSRTLEDSHIESLGDSTIREKTVKIEGAINRVKSQDNMDFSRLNNYISLGGKQREMNRVNVTEVQQIPIPGKGILINNYGHLSFTDYPREGRNTLDGRSGMRKSMASHRPRYNNLGASGQGKYVSELQSKRATKEVASSIQL